MQWCKWTAIEFHVAMTLNLSIIQHGNVLKITVSNIVQCTCWKTAGTDNTYLYPPKKCPWDVLDSRKPPPPLPPPHTRLVNAITKKLYTQLQRN